MNIYYPSVESGASRGRQARHAEVGEFILQKGIALQSRASSTKSLSWLEDVDGVIVERSSFTSQLERECLYADKIGKEILILLDYSRTAHPGSRRPSARLLDVAMSEKNPDARIHVVNTYPTVGTSNDLQVVKSAINMFLDARFGWRTGVPTTTDRLTLEPEPFPNPADALAYDQEYQARIDAATEPDPHLF